MTRLLKMSRTGDKGKQKAGTSAVAPPSREVAPLAAPVTRPPDLPETRASRQGMTRTGWSFLLRVAEKTRDPGTWLLPAGLKLLGGSPRFNGDRCEVKRQPNL